MHVCYYLCMLHALVDTMENPMIYISSLPEFRLDTDTILGTNKKSQIMMELIVLHSSRLLSFYTFNMLSMLA